MTACFIDMMQPITAAEKAGWKLFLALPAPTWRDARMMFRRVHNGMTPLDALTQFVGSSGYEDQNSIDALETVAGADDGEDVRVWQEGKRAAFDSVFIGGSKPYLGRPSHLRYRPKVVIQSSYFFTTCSGIV